jgi:hypothetical protein
MNEMREIRTSAGAVVDTSVIPGWGAAIDPQNNPTYPYRLRENDDHSGQWQRPTVQDPKVEILQSIEHKWRPAVVGTSTPPRALSGTIRRAAFRWTESNLVHWLLLMGADRVNTFEGIFQDIARGRMPNWRFLSKFAAGVVVIAVVVFLADALSD